MTAASDGALAERLEALETAARALVSELRTASVDWRLAEPLRALERALADGAAEAEKP